jgi:hypothetical protein
MLRNRTTQSLRVSVRIARHVDRSDRRGHSWWRPNHVAICAEVEGARVITGRNRTMGSRRQVRNPWNRFWHAGHELPLMSGVNPALGSAVVAAGALRGLGEMRIPPEVERRAITTVKIAAPAAATRAIHTARRIADGSSRACWTPN